MGKCCLAGLDSARSNATRHERGRRESSVWELVFAIRHSEFIRGKIVEEFLTVGWDLFRNKHLEELLLPLGTELARSYSQDGRKEEAIELLDKIANGREPFNCQSLLTEWSRWPTVTMRPVLKLLSKLTGNKEVWIEALHEDICLAEIKGKEIRVYPGGGMWVLESGRLFDEERAIVGLEFSGQIPFAKGTLRIGHLSMAITSR